MKKFGLIIYTIFSIIYFELIFHFFCFNNLNILYSILFLLPLIGIIYLICSMFGKKLNKILLFIFISILTIFFVSQFIYSELFNTIYGIKSVGLMNQVVIVFDKVIDVIINKWYIILLNLIPLVLLIIFNKKIDFQIKRKVNIPLSLTFIIITYIASLLTLYVNKESTYSNYNLYYKTRQPLLTANSMGLLTSFRLETFRTITNFKEEIKLVTEQPVILEKETKYNITNIDFDSIIAETDDDNLNLINTFMKNRQATKQNDYTGLLKGKNVIFILAESLDKDIVNEELTPTLYKLAQESIQFNNYYTPLYNTSTGDGEYVSEWGILPNVNEGLNLYASRNNDNPYMLSNSLKSLGYTTSIYHNYYGYFYHRKEYFNALNYDKIKFCENKIVSSCQDLHSSDLELIKNTINDYIDQDDFFTYYITLSGHGNYIYEKNVIAQKNFEKVKQLEYSNRVKSYMSANIELDNALEYLITTLKEKNKLDDTVIVITPDHYPYYLTDEMINEFSIEDSTNKFLKHKENLIIWNSSLTEQLKNIKIEKNVGNVDILPTMLNLLGIEYDSRLFIGQDALSDSEGLVMFVDQSWLNSNGTYDTTSSEFNGSPNITAEEIAGMNEKVNTYFQISSLIQKENYYTYLFKKIDELNTKQLEEDNETIKNDNVNNENLEQ